LIFFNNLGREIDTINNLKDINIDAVI
jgi:hypothetical protein